MSALAQAMLDAGYVPPKDRLDRALQAAIATPGGWDVRIDALANSIRGDAEVLWLAFQHVRKQCLNELLATATQDKRERDMTKAVIEDLWREWRKSSADVDAFAVAA